MYSVEVYLAVRQFVFVEGHSRKEAGRVFGLHPGTVQKMCAHPKPPGYRRATYPQFRVGPYIEIINSILREDEAAPPKQRHTIRRLVGRLQAEHGYTGSYSAVAKHLRINRPSIREVGVPLLHPPGNAQVDFGESVAVIGGVSQKVHLFCMIFPYSDAPFVKAYAAETMTSFLDGHVGAFEFFGKVPRSILYDNTKLAVAKIAPDGIRKRTKPFSELVSHYLFKDQFCAIRRAQQKAKVEQLVKFSRRNFMTPIPVVDSLDVLNLKLEMHCRDRQGRKSRKKSQSIGERLAADLAACRDLPDVHMDVARAKTCRVGTSSRVQFEENEYSVPTSFVGFSVQLRASINAVEILDGAEVIARHKRCYNQGTIVYDPLHYLALLEMRPGAFDQAAPLKDWKLPRVFARVRGALEARLGEAGKREYIRVLRLLETYEMTRVATGIKDALRSDLVNSEAIKRFIVARIERRPILPGILRRLRKSQAQARRRSTNRNMCAGSGGD